MTLEQLRALLQTQQKAAKNFRDEKTKNADGTPKLMTADEVKELNGLLDAIDNTKANITAAERTERSAAGAVAAAVDGPARVAAEPKGEEKAFKTFGEQLKDIAQAGMNNQNGNSVGKLVWGKAAGANETIPSEGGFLVQTDFSDRLLNLAHETGAIMSRVTNIPISSNANGIKLPTIDETSRARGSRWGGVRAYWLAEGETKVDSKPRFGEISLGLNKLAALGYATDELLQDSTALERIMLQAFAEEIRFEVEDSIINGNGAGKPLGILNSGAVIVIAEETSQANGTVNFYNLVKMMERLPARSRRNAVWLTNDSGVETQLYSVVLPGGNGYPLYLPPGQNTATPGNQAFGTLLGRPVIPTEYLGVTGAAGDLMLVDLSEYITITKGGIQFAESMHVRFIQDEQCFRLVYRIDGQPAWRQPVTTANGGLTKSPFVALGARV